MRARLKTLSTITAVLLAVTAVFVAGAPVALRRRPRPSVRQVVRTAVRRSHPRLIVAASVALFLAAGVVGSAVERNPEAASASPSFRLAASSDTTTTSTTSTTAAPTTTTTAPPPPPTTVAPPPPVVAPVRAVQVSGFVWPARGPLWSGFGPRGGRNHHGTDIGAPNGSPIVAVQGGRVTYAGWESGYGQEVRVDHGGGIVTLYAHMSRINVRVGQMVSQGELLGAVGSTGQSSAPHLHFEVRVGGVPQNPMRWLGGAR
jgi:murein DD-endopeptidase MepM/ murein hydrolase activator NlpD